MPRFERLYAQKYPPDAYRKEVKAMVRVLQERYGLRQTRGRDGQPKDAAGADGDVASRRRAGGLRLVIVSYATSP